MIAHVCGYESGDFIHTFGDAHIYNNHIDQLNLQSSREIRKLPILKIKEKLLIFLILNLKILKF